MSEEKEDQSALSPGHQRVDTDLDGEGGKEGGNGGKDVVITGREEQQLDAAQRAIDNLMRSVRKEVVEVEEENGEGTAELRALEVLQ